MGRHESAGEEFWQLYARGWFSDSPGSQSRTVADVLEPLLSAVKELLDRVDELERKIEERAA